MSGTRQGPFSESQMTLWHDSGKAFALVSFESTSKTLPALFLQTGCFDSSVEVQTDGGAKCRIADLAMSGRHPFKVSRIMI